MKHARLYLSPPHMSGREQEYVADVFASNWIAPVGPHLTRFEKEFAAKVGMKHAVAVTTGTAALHLALRQLDLQPGDEVLCSTFTFCATANPIVYEGAVPVFIDSDRTSWNMDPNLLADELEDCADRGQLPRAVIAADILGQSADLDAIIEIASKYEIPVIDDAAEALGAVYKSDPVGSRGWASVFSFNGNKIITTSGGGMLCSNDEKLIERSRFLATQARDPAPYYEHSTIGFNYRMSNVLAAIGLGQLEVLDERVAVRKGHFEFYRQQLDQLPGVAFMPIASYGQPNYWLTALTVDPAKSGVACQEIIDSLEEENIEARRVWKPMHCQAVFHGCRCRGGAVAEEIFERGLCLPSGSAMSDEDRQRVADHVKSLFA